MPKTGACKFLHKIIENGPLFIKYLLISYGFQTWYS
jgi:hypothetical protein